MKRTLSLIILLTITILAFVSCERFEKPSKTVVEEVDYTEIVGDFYTYFTAVADTISADNIEFFMDFFHADYLHNGQTKQDMEAFVSSIFLINQPRFIDVILLSNDDLHVEWKLVITTTDDLLIEEITYNDAMKEEGETYYLYGNQVEPVEEDKLMVFAEIMTATWCGTCPEVEAAMHDYLYANPETFFYLEYHVMDAIAGEHEFFDNFYGFTNPPVAIIQGDESFLGDQSSLYPSVLDGLKQRDAQFKLSNLVEISNDENYTATVNIEKLTEDGFDTSNLKLRWAFYEEESSVNNYLSQPCRHVVLTEGYYNLTADDLNNTFSMNLDYPRNIPDDMGIVFWLQTANDTYDDDSFVHAWIKQDLGSK